MIEGFALDTEGTLVDLERYHHFAYRQGAKVGGLKYNLLEAIQNIDGFIGGPDEKVARSVCELSNGKANYEYILAVILDTYDRLFQSAKIELREGVLEFFKQAQTLNIPVCLQTGTPEKYAIRILEESGLAKMFPKNLIVLPSHVARSKPAPDSFLETAKRLGIKPEQQLVFGDSTRDVIAATKAGSQVIGMPVYDFPEVFNPLFQEGAVCIYQLWTDIDLPELVSFLNA